MATQTSPRRLLGDIAWAHSGDKGDCVNLGVVARDPRDYAFLLQHVTAHYHDVASDEAKGVLEPFERSKLPESYQGAFGARKNGEFVAPFEVEDRQRGVPKFIIAQLVNVVSEGEYTMQDLRNQIREQLTQEKSYRRLLDGLRKETYVTVLLDGGDKVNAISP